MKRYLYTLLLALALPLYTACTDDADVLPADKPTGETSSLRITMHIPEYQIAPQTRATSYENLLNDISLLVFDQNGLFLQRVAGYNLNSLEDGSLNGYGTFSADVPAETRIIHYIANYENWASFDERVALHKDERELVPSLITSNLVFWGRSTVAAATATDNVTLFRNQAKITVESNASNFTVTGYGIANFSAQGTISPFNSSEANPFVILDNKPTLAAGESSRADQTEADCDMSAKYMLENENLSNNQTYVIVKGILQGQSKEQFYKIQLLDAAKSPYTIVRNYHYRVVIQSFNSQANGSSTFDDAKNAEASNNIYAEIFKESPTISDNNNNTLTVGQINALFVRAGNLSIPAEYTQNGVLANNQIQVTITEDPGSILTNLTYNSSTGLLTANVKGISNGQQVAVITVKAGVLSRTITVTSSRLYTFNPAAMSPELYTERDQDVALNFTIPSTVPASLFPVKCEITTNNLYPVSPNKDMEIEFVNGVYKYIYWATTAGAQSLNFRTSYEDSDETATIENNFFQTAEIKVQSRYFSNVSVNNGSNVNYGVNSAANIKFTIPSFPDNPASYPLTVKILTNNLTTTAAGWTAISGGGGYQHTYTSAPTGEQTIAFRSNKALSHESVMITADNFRPTTVAFDNILAQNYIVTGPIRRRSTFYVQSVTINSSNTSITNNFRSTTSSTYSIQLKVGNRVSDSLTFSAYINRAWYYTSMTIEQLLQGQMINLQ